MKVPTRPKGLLEPPVPLSQRWPAEIIANPAAALGNQRAALPRRFDPGTCESEQLSFLSDPPRSLLSAVSDIILYKHIYTDVRARTHLTCLRPKATQKIRPSGHRSHLVPVTLAGFSFTPMKGTTKQRIEVSALQYCFLKVLMTTFTPGPNSIALFCFYDKYFIQFYF